MILIRYYSACK